MTGAAPTKLITTVTAASVRTILFIDFIIFVFLFFTWFFCASPTSYYFKNTHLPAT
jgi:hypothetical protein